MEGNNIKIHIGKGTTMTRNVHINAQEDNTKIEIGDDCMFSNHIIIRTSDSHPIIDINTGKRINNAKDVIIGKHVWLAPQVTVMKGTVIEDNAIVGSNSLVTKRVKSNTLVVGYPAKEVKADVTWTREKIF